MRNPIALWMLFVVAASCASKRERATESAPVAAATPTSTTSSMSDAPSSGENAPSIDERKIVVHGELVIRVADTAKARSEIEAWVSSVGGHVASADVARDGDRARATLVLRIPAGGVANARGWLAQLGELLRESTRADDVTEAYTDLRARLANARKLEARLLELVARETDGVADLLVVEKELARVREQIELHEGRLRLYDDQIALATLTVSLTPDEKMPVVASSSLGDDVGGTLSSSWDVLGAFGRGLLLFAVALVPWSPLIAGAIVLFVWVRRRWWRARRA